MGVCVIYLKSEKNMKNQLFPSTMYIGPGDQTQIGHSGKHLTEPFFHPGNDFFNIEP